MAAGETVFPGGSEPGRMTAKQLRHKAQEFLASKKYANNLVDIINQWPQSSAVCILTLETIFLQVLRRRDMYLERTVALNFSDSSPELVYTNWLRNCYEEIWEKIIYSFDNEKTSTQVQSLTTALKLMAEEGKFPIEPPEKFAYYFPLHRLKPILMKLLSQDRDNSNLIARFEEIASYKDALYYTWRSLPALTPKTQPQELFIKNLFELIHKLPLPKPNEPSKEIEKEALLCAGDDSPTFIWDHASARSALNDVWACVMHWDFTPKLHKQLLIVLLERVMPYLEKPVLLTDFLMDSLDADGSIGLLALQGVFILVTEHNLDYPNIFTKLYSMFEPEIFHTKYKSRLFYVSDLFLCSTHLPESLVAAFIKRLARLSLVAPPEDIYIILTFIGNLLLRYPGLKRLIDHSQSGENNESPGNGDPFLMEERDPFQSNALLSSLWEVQALQNHILPVVATTAKSIPESASINMDVAAALEKEIGKRIFDNEIKKKVKDIMLTFERPSSMALIKGERLLQFWQFNDTH